MERVEGIGGRSLFGFFQGAVSRLANRSLIVPVIALAILLTCSNIVILQNKPEAGAAPSAIFALAAAARVLGLIVILVAILRIMTASERRPWMPDAGFWLYLLLSALTFAVAAMINRGLIGAEGPGGMLLSNILLTILTTPFAAWLVAVASRRPLAFNPAPWMRDFSAWLPQLIFWAILLITPAAVLHATLDKWLIGGAGEYFWPVALIDGPLSVFIAVMTAALNVEAHSRVARG